MARFYREFVERIIVALILLTSVEKESPKTTILQHLQKFKSGNPNDDDIVYRAISRWADFRQGDEDYIANEEVLAGALGQMRKTKQQDTDLIETIVKTLQLPFSAHYFYPAHLKALREAILRPDELMSWKKSITENNLKCKCGHAFESHEAVITRSVGDGTYEILCHKCARPQRVACDRCGEAFMLSEKINYMGKVECGCHKKKPEEQTPTPPLPPQPGRATPRPTRFMRALDETARIYIGGTAGTPTNDDPLFNHFVTDAHNTPTLDTGDH